MPDSRGQSKRDFVRLPYALNNSSAGYIRLVKMGMCKTLSAILTICCNGKIIIQSWQSYPGFRVDMPFFFSHYSSLHRSRMTPRRLLPNYTSYIAHSVFIICINLRLQCCLIFWHSHQWRQSEVSAYLVWKIGWDDVIGSSGYGLGSVVGWRVGLGPIEGFQSAKPRWPAKRNQFTACLP